ncbi:MAG: NAD(P)-dependent dehydrogenase (short-subunit alcohol dehydrogenase family) [Dinoroseobacter sp.]|jgi:NAD(P)-dependent dehydrogenase (short-subunit alcohol dehydrogenase family)
MQVTQDLTGRRAVVTGAGRGLGYAIAHRLAQSGASITAIDLAGALGAVPAQWTRFPVDLTAPDAEQKLAEAAGAHQVIDIVVANAGLVPPWRSVEALVRDEWEQIMTLNVWAAAQTLGAFAPCLARSDHASAIVMASINSFSALPKQMLYTASKHAVIGVMRAAALDLGPQGVRVNALAPGPIATDALLSRLEARHRDGGLATEVALEELASGTALKRLATAEDVANAAHFLASDASAGMTGSIIPVEAGLS